MRVELADDRIHEEVLDRHTGYSITLDEYMGGGDYGSVVNEKRVGLKLQLAGGQLRYVCPYCEEPMVLASKKLRDRKIERFFFQHESRNNPCTGSVGLSEAAICARKFGHSKESALHKQFKVWLLESMAADAAFSMVDPEKRWKDIDSVRWRQPDVQGVRDGWAYAFEAQLSTTFLHVITARMRFYESNQGRLLWLFRDLDVTHFRMAEDDIFYSNNRNAFRVTEQTVATSKAEGRFALECVWHEPVDAIWRNADETRRQLVFFDQLHFDVSATGVPRAYFFNYDAALEQLEQRCRQEREAAARKAEQQRLERIRARDQSLRDEMEALFAIHPAQPEEVNRRWAILRGSLSKQGISLPDHIDSDPGPFYLLMAAYSAKRGQVVACKLKNFAELENNLFGRHKEALWIFRVMAKHYCRTQEMQREGDPSKWRARRAEYTLAWRKGTADFAPNRGFDRLLEFLLPDSPAVLWQDPSDTF